jgi:AraC family transcriptional regulator, regulatory protein of adaptative response / DNA-3-methyladenine glycosylase II
VDHERQRVDLSYRPPMAFDALVEFLGARAVPGVEEVADGAYRRVLRLPGGPGVVELAHSATSATITCRLRLADPRDRPAAVAACRRLLDLDADLVAVDRALAGDPVLGPLVTATPGRRAPGHVDADELAIRAVLGQQVTLAAARGLAARLTDLCGERLPAADGGLTTAFPSPAAIADADLGLIGMPGTRRATIRTLAAVLAAGEIVLDPDATRHGHDEAEAALLGLRGIGPWTAAYIRMRGLGDPDVFLAGDVGVRRALAAAGVAGDADGVAAGDRWRPWRSYAVHQLWASLS